MPKLNNIHLPERIQEHINKMEKGIEVEAKKDKTLLNDKQQQALKRALLHQQQLKKIHKRPKTKEDKDKIGWKEIREVRLEIYRQALRELKNNTLNEISKLQRQREAKAARVFMDAWSKAIDEGKSEWSAKSAGYIAQTRAGFGRPQSTGLTKRDREIQQMEEAILKQLASQSSQNDKQQKVVAKKSAKIVASKRKGK